MNLAEYETLTQHKAIQARVCGADLAERTPRTLLFGYTCDRETWHVYLDDDGAIKRVIYGYPNTCLSVADESTLLPEECIPNKRLYPEACDLEFCCALKELGLNLPFTVFNSDREPGRWYGLRHEDLSVANAA